MVKGYLALIAFVFFLTACEDVALMTTPKKQPIQSTSQLAKLAETNFWYTLHAGRFDQIPDTDRLLMAAYLENPNDPQLAAHLGFLHIWKITERQRMKNIPPTITNEIILSKQYFQDAVELNPQDARYLGFYGDSQIATGSIFHDEREQVRGYFTLKRAIRAWPQFNYFTAGYVMSTLPADSKQFKEAVEWQWKTLDLCAKQKINRLHPDFSAYLNYETQEGDNRACWNSVIAPHNFSGFFMNMGDMLVKSGDWQTGIQIYQNAKLAKNYPQWPYRKMLENRILHARENVKNFQHENKMDSANKNILFNSGYGCMACHQVGVR